MILLKLGAIIFGVMGIVHIVMSQPTRAYLCVLILIGAGIWVEVEKEKK